MACKMIASDGFAIPETHHGIHGSTDYFSGRGVGAGTDPFFVPVFFIVELSDVFAAIAGCEEGYRLYYLSPWSALPVTKLFLPTASEKTGCPWTGEQEMESRGPLRNCA